MKSTSVFIAFLVFYTCICTAQDKKAEAILDAMSKKYKAIAAYTADFSYGVETNASKLNKVMTGSVLVKGNKFKLKTAGQEIFNNGKELYTFVKENNEVNISSATENDENDFSPTKIYSIYKKGYKYIFKEEKIEAGQTYEVIELSPSTNKSNVSKIQISVNKKDKGIKSWKVWDKAGKKTVFKIDKFTPTVPVSDAMFVFDKKKYPGVEVVDLR